MTAKTTKLGFNEPPLRREYKNEPVDAIVNDVLCHFRSKLEYRWAQYLDFLKTAGEIKDFFYEFHTFYFDGGGSPKEYTPDFLIRNQDNGFEYHECKGYLQKFDLDKFKRMFDERPKVKITIVFWSKPKLSAQKRNKLERYCSRIIWNAKGMLKDVPIDMA